MKSLLIGCGNSRAKKVFFTNQPKWLGELVTVDMDPNCGATHVFDMSSCCKSMPFGDEEFDEIHLYDSLEHWGMQGDWRGWFDEFAEYHRMLKPGGSMGIVVPIGADALADPGHCRFITGNHFLFLSRSWYQEALGKGMQVTDYRWAFDYDFKVEFMQQQNGHHLAVLLRKPS